MFDCVYPCRTARFGTALVPEGQLRLTRAEFKHDERPLEEGCPCPCCKNGYSRAYLHTIAAKQPAGCVLLTLHNIAYMMRFLDGLRSAVLEQRFPAHARSVLERWHPGKSAPPLWVKDALMGAGLEVEDWFDWTLAAPAEKAEKKDEVKVEGKGEVKAEIKIEVKIEGKTKVKAEAATGAA